MDNAESAQTGIAGRPSPLHLRILGSPLSVFFDAGVTNSQAHNLAGAWARCLASERQSSPHQPVSTEKHESQQPYRGRIATATGTSRITARTFEQFASQLTSTVTTVGIDSRAGELMMLHASGLADPSTGRTAALVGRSGMGKTTATRTLGKEFGYITDETLAIDRAGNIVPYAKPLSVINTDPPAPKVQVGPDELGLLPAPSELKLAAVVLLDRNPLADEPRITPLTNADAIIELIPQTSSLARIRRPLQWLCSLLDACGGAVRITYRESEELLPILPGLLHRPAAPAQWFPAIEDNEIGSSKSESGTILRAEIIDAVELPKGNDETELLAMTGHHVLRLAGIAPAIWHATRIPATGIHDIAERIASVSNVPHGYQGTLSAAVQHLESHGILTRT